jgi:GST-like protein
MFQMGGIGPMFGQFGFFHKFAGKDIDDIRPLERYRDESIRLLSVLDKQLAKGDYIVGNDYSIADIATWPWLRAMTGFYEAGDLVGMDNFKNVQAWENRCMERPASQKAVNIPAGD